MNRLSRILSIAGVAVLTFHMARTQVAERYRVPSASMEPTIHGDPKSGDLVMVDKLAFRFADPKPNDLVVVRNGREGQIVKRMIYLATSEGGFVAIRFGDVWVGPNASDLARMVKDPIADRDLRITHCEFPGLEPASSHDQDWRGGTLAGRTLELAPAARDGAGLVRLVGEEAQDRRRRADPPDLYVPGLLSTRHPVDLSFLDLTGRRHAVGMGFDRDLGLELELIPREGCTALLLVLEHHDVYWTFLYTASGQVTFRRGGTQLGAAGSAPPFTAGKCVTLGFGHLDGRFFLEVGGRLVSLLDQDLEDTLTSPRYPGTRFENLLHCGAAGGAVVLTRMRAFRDLWYRGVKIPFKETGAPMRVEAGRMFLLGDNTFDSQDSRNRSESEQFRREDLLGRPLCVLAPFARARWLTR